MIDFKTGRAHMTPGSSTHSQSTSTQKKHDVRLLPCEQDDTSEIEAFVQKVNATVATPSGTWERFTARVMQKSSALHLLVPEQESEPVGYAALEGEYLSFFALLPRYRRRGLGGQVIESLLHKNGGTLCLHVRASNDAARCFYDGLASLRISVTVAEDGCYDDGGARLRYVLALRPDKNLS